MGTRQKEEEKALSQVECLYIQEVDEETRRKEKDHMFKDSVLQVGSDGHLI